MNTPEDREREDRFLGRTAEVFEKSVRELDGETRSRLGRARRTALDAARRPVIGLSAWLPAGVAAAVLLVVFAWSGRSPTVVEGPDAAADFEILLETHSLEMLEDLEFYSWIDLEEGGGNVG